MASGDLLGEEGRLADDPGGDQPLRRTSGMTGAATISNYVISFVRLFVFEMCSSLVMSVPPLRSSSMKAISSGDGSRGVPVWVHGRLSKTAPHASAAPQ
jgi:hypothetical protein